MDDDDGNDKHGDTVFDFKKETGVFASKSAKKPSTPGREDQPEVIDSQGACVRWLVTLTLCASFLGLGMSISVLGPTFQDLAMNVKKSINNISYIFVGRSAGYIGGSVIGGVLINCMSPHLLLGISLLFTAFGMCAIPFCKQAMLLTAYMCGIGVSMGVLDTGGNLLVLKTWGEQAGPHMQALHFSFAAGAFVSPIIAKLLFEKDGAVAGVVPTNFTPPDTTGHVTTAPATHTLIHVKSGTFTSMWAYIVIGFFVLFTSFLFFFLYSCNSQPGNKASTTMVKPLVAKHHLALVVLLFFFFFAYVGSEVAYGSFIFTFAKDYSHMTQSQAAGLNSLFWGTFAMCRGLAIFFAACLYPGTMILLSLVGTTMSSLFLCLFYKNKVALWLCTGLYGASMATTFPSGISWLEQYTTVTGHTASAFVVGAALGEMVLPALVGYLLGRFPNYPLLLYLSFITAICTSILFPVMYKLASDPYCHHRKPCTRGRLDFDEREYRQALLDSGAEEEDDKNGVEQWDDTDFEVIQMVDTSSLVNSSNKVLFRPDVSTLMTGASSSPLNEAAGGSFFPHIISSRDKMLL